MNLNSIRPLLRIGLTRPVLLRTSWSRNYYYKFKRTKVPPLPEPKESPFIVGPYLKPDYLPISYITEPVRTRYEDDLDHFIYEPTKIEPNEDRTVKLLLIDDVEGLGVAGQIIDAPYRIGASKLVAMKKAEYFTEFSTKWYKFGPKTSTSASSALSPKTARLLRSNIYELPIAPTTPVKPWHISLALRLAGCLCPIEAIDESSISEYLGEDVKRGIKCIIIINNHERIEVKFSYAKKFLEQDMESNKD